MGRANPRGQRAAAWAQPLRAQHTGQLRTHAEPLSPTENGCPSAGPGSGSVERLGHLSHAAQVSSCGVMTPSPSGTPWPAAQPHPALTTLLPGSTALGSGCSKPQVLPHSRQGTSKGRALGWHRQMGAPGHTRGASWGAQRGGPSLPHPLSAPTPSRRCFCRAATHAMGSRGDLAGEAAAAPRPAHPGEGAGCEPPSSRGKMRREPKGQGSQAAGTGLLLRGRGRLAGSCRDQTHPQQLGRDSGWELGGANTGGGTGKGLPGQGELRAPAGQAPAGALGKRLLPGPGFALPGTAETPRQTVRDSAAESRPEPAPGKGRVSHQSSGKMIPA